MTGLSPIITRAGLRAVVRAEGNGLQAVIDRVVVGRGVASGASYVGYTPQASAIALRDPMVSVPILSGSVLDPHGFRILAAIEASSPGSYPINEVGFLLSDGTLLAVWSDPAGPLAYKTALAGIDLAFDLMLEALPLNALTISVVSPDIPDTSGVLASLLAGQAELTTQLIRTNERLLQAGI